MSRAEAEAPPVEPRSNTKGHQVKFFDVVMSRALVEICTGSLSIFLVFFIAACSGAGVIPHDAFAFCESMLLALSFALGVGFLNVFISQLFQQWMIVTIVPMLIIYFSSGTVIAIEAMPAVVQDYVQWNPLVHIVKVCRSAFYLNYGADADIVYVLVVSGALALIGLLGIRFVVPRFLN
ncbi:ABC transporter permease [Methylobacterium sp. ap11]|uniref:ABC transporter permease n=1 Tax=Methylobacterium sp. ap11 TaxID=1761799 RepID=UPI000AC0CDCD|nr:ABC transporter permease [Methylobacterium sp. ap11]